MENSPKKNGNPLTNPYRIKITGRTKHHINAFGEELIIENAEEALRNSCQKTGAEIMDYTAAPIFMSRNEKGAHEWIIEFRKAPEEIEYFTEVLDNALKSINSDYEAKRYNSMTLKMPKVHMARKNLFYDWLKSKGKLGGQHKIPRFDKVAGTGTVTFSQCHFDAWDSHKNHNDTVFHNGTAAIRQFGGTLIVSQSEFTQVFDNPTRS